ncbi:MotB family protein [Pseudohoeflea coraliihabitans]|uniref:MotB family protein n=1 Tax=Pseudohoeflea coraliihabitans TaxID=2860393 RepID=A0ABS6WN42_9HYPH|nr:MotB family protein [Pseudohoeflea sp. DP4N28-3]
MSDDAAIHEGKNEIIIVRRRSNGEDSPHGGSWKIAYADFMTAMMAFFLVMWLINAANEETKAAVASYFNPIKLTDSRPAERGIKQVGNNADGELNAPRSQSIGDAEAKGESAATGEQQTSSAGEKTDYSEADYFKDPYAVLAEIIQETGIKSNLSDKGDGGVSLAGSATGASGGEAFRDPFEPDFWARQIEEDDAAKDVIASSEALLREQYKKKAPPPNQTGEESQPAQDAAEAGNAAAEQAGTDLADGEQQDASEDEARRLEDQLSAAFDEAQIGKLADGLSVVPSDGGLLVSLTDQLDVEMFRVGSAVPERPLVLAMDEIGKVLAERDGTISIRGHTDARPFTDGTDDNWRLSMERAHSAFFMLVRGGVAEERIRQLSGFAERDLKDLDNPFAEANRRIEILIRFDES